MGPRAVHFQTVHKEVNLVVLESICWTVNNTKRRTVMNLLDSCLVLRGLSPQALAFLPLSRSDKLPPGAEGQKSIHERTRRYAHVCAHFETLHLPKRQMSITHTSGNDVFQLPPRWLDDGTIAPTLPAPLPLHFRSNARGQWLQTAGDAS